MIYGKKSHAGFTLIELMVVIAIIAILTAIITANFTSAKSRSRDTKRVSDIAQIQLALAGFFDRCNAYPATLDTTATSATCPSGITLGSFISRIPSPPNSSEYYFYAVNATGNAYDDYFLNATLENQGSASNNSLLTAPSSSYAISSVPAYVGTPPTSLTCNIGVNYCVGPK